MKLQLSALSCCSPRARRSRLIRNSPGIWKAEIPRRLPMSSYSSTRPPARSIIKRFAKWRRRTKPHCNW